MTAAPRLTHSDLIAVESRHEAFALFQRLGYQGADRPNPAELRRELLGGDPHLSGVTGLYKIGTVGNGSQASPGLAAYLVEANQHQAVMHRVALRLRDTTDHVLLLVAVPGSDGRYSTLAFGNIRIIPRGIRSPVVQVRKLIVDRAKPTAHDMSVLQSLAAVGLSADQAYEAQMEAFDVERLTNRFYLEYRDRFVQTMEKIRSANPRHPEFTDKKHGEATLDGFTQRLMSRLLFIYFLQKKGWLNGDPKFLEKWFDRLRGRWDGSYHAEFLNALFFQVFANERSKDESPYGTIPYLNGTLFERDPRFDPPKVRVPNIVFDPENDNSLLSLFLKYNFTVSEESREETEVALAPELLGKVFENLLADEKRSETGSFYTPRAVVRAMCESTLALHLARATMDRPDWDQAFFMDLFEPDNLRSPLQITEREATRLLEILGAIRILDPAVGSGAFPLGMLHAILHLRRIFEEARGLKVDERKGAFTEWKEQVIRNQLFGVDKLPQAVEMCRLRLWLSLVVDQDRDAVRPLPNLEYNIVRGDSLRERVAGITIFRASKRSKQAGLGEFMERQDAGELYSLVRDLPELKKVYATEHDPKEKSRLRREIDATIQEAMEKALKQQLDRLRRKLDSLGRNSRAKKVAKQVRELLGQEASLKSQLEQVTDRLWSTFFVYELYFADVFGEMGGFDIVVGNPPYLRTEEYQDLMGELEVESSNLFGLFWARALRDLCRPGGLVSFITPDPILTIETHKALRRQMLERTIVTIANLPHWFFTFNMAYTCVLTIINEPPPPLGTITAIDITQSPRSDYEALETGMELIREERTGPIDLELGSDKPPLPAARYVYDRVLPHQSRLCPLFVGDPNLFKLMWDEGANVPNAAKSPLTYGRERRRVPIREALINGQTRVTLVHLGSIAEVKQGIATGDNPAYVRSDPRIHPEGDGSRYPPVDLLKCLKEDELEAIRKKPDKYRRKGISPGDFGGRHYVPLDMSGKFDEEGHPPWMTARMEYWIDWSGKALRRMETLTIADRKKLNGETIERDDDQKIAAVIRNREFYFRQGLLSIRVGDQAPIVREFSAGIFDSGANCIFPHKDEWVDALAVYLNSPLARYLCRCFINSTFNFQVDDLLEVPVPIEILLNPPKEFTNLLHRAKETDGMLSPDEWGPVARWLERVFGIDDSAAHEIREYTKRRYPRFYEHYYGRGISEQKHDILPT